ncbi:MAG TPA: hypothetical protein VE056_10500 [Pyrinomonadaceae bacterium]|nr:hypothetical protein [Pyrinomonadaceae bacterium]
MNRRLIVARLISVTGVLLLIVAAIHLLVTPVLKSFILDRVLTPQELRIVSPPFLLNHIVVGILLIPLGFITLYTAAGIRAGERWAWVINLAIGLTILSLPVVLVFVMRAEYFQALPFLIATALITIVGITMTAALMLVRHDFRK